MVKIGLYLNEDNGQTFELVDSSRSWCYIQFQDFFWDSIVYADEKIDGIKQLITTEKITYIGKV